MLAIVYARIPGRRRYELIRREEDDLYACLGWFGAHRLLFHDMAADHKATALVCVVFNGKRAIHHIRQVGEDGPITFHDRKALHSIDWRKL